MVIELANEVRKVLGITGLGIPKENISATTRLTGPSLKPKSPMSPLGSEVAELQVVHGPEHGPHLCYGGRLGSKLCVDRYGVKHLGLQDVLWTIFYRIDTIWIMCRLITSSDPKFGNVVGILGFGEKNCVFCELLKNWGKECGYSSYLLLVPISLVRDEDELTLVFKKMASLLVFPKGAYTMFEPWNLISSSMGGITPILVPECATTFSSVMRIKA
uniref:Gamma-glutamylcyclotransferase 2-1-like n=1 Tax=Tanacetum cinerariifolium TaxID=118510 RepID=A0A699HKW2_TANCI|nr:gamma-glutamylcyclotransferase 2-1-like [Tanacetum cinerariifolium]